jgi:hypothetical protein
MRKPQDWSQSCPNPDCSHYRLINRDNISAISTCLAQNGKRRIFRCSACERCVPASPTPLTTATALPIHASTGTVSIVVGLQELNRLRLRFITRLTCYRCDTLSIR